MKTNFEAIYGSCPEGLAAAVKEFLAKNEIQSANIQVEHVSFNGRVSFYAYVTWEGKQNAKQGV